MWNIDWTVNFPMTIWQQKTVHMKFEIGSTAYIVEDNRIVREVTVVKQSSDFTKYGSVQMAAFKLGVVDCL